MWEKWFQVEGRARTEAQRQKRAWLEEGTEIYSKGPDDTRSYESN